MAPETKSQMNALVAPKYCTPDQYELTKLPKPEINNPHDVLIKIYAASINSHDVKEAKGWMRPLHKIPLPKILAYDLSGVVTAVGSSVTKFRPGNAVYGMLPLTCYDKGTAAEFVVVTEGELALKPSNLTHVQAASLPLVLYTTRTVLNKSDGLIRGGLKGKTVFIPGGLSGTGSVAIQLAKHVYGAGHVITTVSTSKRPLISQYLGEETVDEVIDYTTQDVIKEVGPGSVDFVFDTLGIMTSLIPLVKEDGVILTIAAMPRSDLMKKEEPDMAFWLGWILNVVNWYYSWKLSGRNISYDFVFGAHRNGDLDLVGGWVDGKKLRAVVGKVADFSDLEGMREGLGEVNKATGSVGKFVIRMVNEEGK